MKFKDNFPELGHNQWAMLLRLLMEVAPEKKLLEVEEPHLFQGVGGGSAQFYCSACQTGEMTIMDNTEGDKYFCKCSYWSDPHNAFLDRSGGNWLGWKNKQAAQDYLDSLPVEENGWNDSLEAYQQNLTLLLEGRDGGY